jgi:hypothetical protein
MGGCDHTRKDEDCPTVSCGNTNICDVCSASPGEEAPCVGESCGNTDPCGICSASPRGEECAAQNCSASPNPDPGCGEQNCTVTDQDCICTISDDDCGGNSGRGHGKREVAGFGPEAVIQLKQQMRDEMRRGLES